MAMIKSVGSVSQAKSIIENMMGKGVEVTLNLGRNKFVSFLGKISAVYPALFVVTPKDDFNGKTAYSYSEYLCGKVKISASKPD